MSEASDYLPSLRLAEVGWEGLSEIDLLCLMLTPGQSEVAALADSIRVLKELGSIRRLKEESYQVLRRSGLSHRRSLALLAFRHLARRLRRRMLSPSCSFRSSIEIFRYFQPHFEILKRECFWTLLLDGKNRIQRIVRVSEGSLTASLVHPREVFRPAIAEGAAGVLFVHNHPSGEPEPSQEDIQITRRLVETGRLLGIPVLDHVIIGSFRHFSFADQGML